MTTEPIEVAIPEIMESNPIERELAAWVNSFPSEGLSLLDVRVTLSAHDHIDNRAN